MKRKKMMELAQFLQWGEGNMEDALLLAVAALKTVS
jgi:hypothetical protein